MKDKLDILIDILGKNKNEEEFHIASLFSGIKDSDAFLFLYESIDIKKRPNLKNCCIEFKENFLKAISEQEETTFNKYFFEVLKERLTNDEVRNLHFKFPKNEKLKLYLKNIDNPKNIDEIISVLFKLWMKKSENYVEMLEKYLPKLNKLNLIESKKSRAANNFSEWGKNYINKNGVKDFIDFCESFNLNIFSFCKKTDLNFPMDIVSMKIEDFDTLLEFSKNILKKENTDNKYKSEYEIIEKIIGYQPILETLINLSKSEQKNKFIKIWDTQQYYFKKVVDKKCLFSTKNKNGIEIIDILLDNTNYFYNPQMNFLKEDLKYMKKYIQCLELEVTLKNDLNKKNNISIKI